jgi:hypothetical protein
MQPRKNPIASPSTTDGVWSGKREKPGCRNPRLKQITVDFVDFFGNLIEICHAHPNDAKQHVSRVSPLLFFDLQCNLCRTSIRLLNAAPKMALLSTKDQVREVTKPFEDHNVSQYPSSPTNKALCF